MPIDKKLFRELEQGFRYLEDFDNLGAKFPDQRVPLNITVSASLKAELMKKSGGNLSRYVESKLA